MNNLLDQITELKLLQTDTIAIDATKLNAYERAKWRSRIDKGICFYLDWGTKFDYHKNQIPLYGLNINAAVETKL